MQQDGANEDPIVSKVYNFVALGQLHVAVYSLLLKARILRTNY